MESGRQRQIEYMGMRSGGEKNGQQAERLAVTQEAEDRASALREAGMVSALLHAGEKQQNAGTDLACTGNHSNRENRRAGELKTGNIELAESKAG
jgi:hypothetical protein